MSKNATDKTSYLNRTGDHSTKPFKTGPNTHLAGIDYGESEVDAAAENIIRARELEKQLNALAMKQNHLTFQNADIKARLADTLPKDRFYKIKKEAIIVGNELQTTQQQISILGKELHRLGRSERKGDFEGFFVEVASRVLPKSVYERIKEAAKNLLDVQDNK